VGKGFGSFTVTADGKTTISGRTADGETFTSASHLSQIGKLMLFSMQKGKPQGSVVGEFRLNSQSDEDDANNVIASNPEQLSWWKPESTDPKARIYKDGVGPVDLIAVGGRYNAPVSPQVVLDMDAGASNALLVLTGASLPGPWWISWPETKPSLPRPSLLKPLSRSMPSWAPSRASLPCWMQTLGRSPLCRCHAL
jgi:hypothetical protein